MQNTRYGNPYGRDQQRAHGSSSRPSSIAVKRNECYDPNPLVSWGYVGGFIVAAVRVQPQYLKFEAETALDNTNEK